MATVGGRKNGNVHALLDIGLVLKQLEILLKCVARRELKFLHSLHLVARIGQRPKSEVDELMELFLIALQREVKKLHKNNVRLRIIGDIASFNSNLQKRIIEAEELTKNNQGLTLNIAANYGGQWDITQAAKSVAKLAISGAIDPSQINSELLQSYLSLSDLPDPDLFIRTSGEQRISKFSSMAVSIHRTLFYRCLLA